MNRNSFFLVAGSIFALVALAHLLRIYMARPVIVASWAVPMWMSWAGLVVAGGLSYLGLRFAARG